jgi:ectoine hydrolase
LSTICKRKRGFLVTTALPPAPDDAEYADRLRRVRAAMTDRSLRALVVTDPANLYYLTGYNAWSFYTPQCLIVPADGDIRLFARAMDADGAGNTSWLPAGQIEGYPEALVHRPDAHPFDWIARRGRDTGALPSEAGAVVAVEGDSHFFSVRGYQALVAGLPGVRFEDSRELVNWVRVVKSPYEQQVLRVAGSITDAVMSAALTAMEPGRRQCDVVAEIMRAQAAGTPEHGGDYPAIVPMLPTGETAGTPHMTWNDKPFVSGEATTIELAGVYRRYHVPLARTVMFGAPQPRLAALADTVTEGMAAALAALRPGATPHRAHAAFTGVISRDGLTKESRIGYSIGVGYPPDWGERTVSLRADDHTELTAGMAFHVILGMWMDGWGYELSEPVLITESGAERLTHQAQLLTVKG